MNYLKNPIVIMVFVSSLLLYMMKKIPKQDMEQMQEKQKDQIS
jgi:hypothetical protein